MRGCRPAGGGSAGAADLPASWLSESVTERCALRSGRVGAFKASGIVKK